MNKYLFIFGYETPKQKRNNELNGWDDEDSGLISIVITHSITPSTSEIPI